MKRTRRLRTSFIDRVLFRVRVSGESCWPVLVPGRLYWASALAPLHVGDFIVFGDPADGRQILVKKILAVRDSGYEVGSTVSWGSSSGDFGIVDKKNVLGKIMRWNTR